MDLVRNIEKLVKDNKELKARNAELEQQASNRSDKSNHVIMRSRLRKMGVNYDDISPIFDVETTIIAGGLILQIMLEEFWQSDINIFTTSAQVVINILYSHHPYWIKDIDRVYDDECNHSIPFKKYVGEYVGGVNITVTEVQDVTDEIHVFDLDFCQCYFNGCSFYTMNPDSLINRTHRGFVEINSARAKKYEMRGFTILPPLQPYADNFDEDCAAEPLEDDMPDMPNLVDFHTPPVIIVSPYGGQNQEDSVYVTKSNIEQGIYALKKEGSSYTLEDGEDSVDVFG